MCFSAPWNFVSPELKLRRLLNVINSQKYNVNSKEPHLENVEEKNPLIYKALGCEAPIDCWWKKTLMLKKSGGEKRSLHWGSRFSLLFIANIYYISYDANNSKSHPCWNSSSSCHEGIKETQRDRDRKKYVLCAIPLFPYKIKTKT